MWTQHSTLLIFQPEENNYRQHIKTIIDKKTKTKTISITAFDFDGTLITQKSGKTYPVSFDDWKPLYDCVKDKFLNAYNNNIVILFTNQSGVERKDIDIDFLKKRFDNFFEYLGVSVPVYISTCKDKYRKPSPEMWSTALDYLGNILYPVLGKDCNIDEKESVYIGDAAGRKVNWKPGKKKDFACSDRKFAYNCGIQFLTPEEYFLSENLSDDLWSYDTFNPFTYQKEDKEQLQLQHRQPDKQTVYMLIGPPGAGKSTFCTTHLDDCIRINMDTLKTKPKCMKLLKESLSGNKSIVIDNTSPTVISRKEYIDCTKKCNKDVRIVAIHINTPKELAQHFNCVREMLSNGQQHKKVPDVVYNSYYKRFEPPTLQEGFNDVVTLSQPIVFENDLHKSYFMRFY